MVVSQQRLLTLPSIMENAGCRNSYAFWTVNILEAESYVLDIALVQVLKPLQVGLIIRNGDFS